MNNAYFAKNTKLQTRNRSGMIRSYRTSRTMGESVIALLNILLTMFDRGLDILARPMIRRVLRGSIAISCVVGFICVIGAIESHSITLLPALVISIVLVILEVLCLRGNE